MAGELPLLMGTFEIRLRTRLPPEEALVRVLDLDAHTALIPFTTVSHTGVLRSGSTFIARTGVGRLGFDDPMIVEMRTARRCRIRKTGRIRGHIDIEAIPQPHGSQLLWRQHIAGIPVSTRLARLAYTIMLRRLLKY